MAKVTVKQDGTGDYTTIAAAATAIRDTFSDSENEINIYEGVYQESVSIEGRRGDNTTYYSLEINFLEGARMDGGGVLSDGLEVWFFAQNQGVYIKVNGLNASNYTTNQFRGDIGTDGYTTQNIILNKCYIEGDCYFGRCLLTYVIDSIFNNSIFSYTTNGNGGSIHMQVVEGSTFISCENVNVFNRVYGLEDSKLKRNYFKNSKIGILNNYTLTDVETNNNIFDNCEVRSYEGSESLVNAKAEPYTAVSNISELNAVTTPLVLTTDEIDFKTVVLDSEGFPTTESEYVKNHHVGAYRYANTGISNQSRVGANTEILQAFLPPLTTGARKANKVVLNHTFETIERIAHASVGISYDGVTENYRVPVKSGLQPIGGKNYFRQTDLISGNVQASISSTDVSFATARAAATGTVNQSEFQAKTFTGFTIQRAVGQIDSVKPDLQAGSIIKLIALNDTVTPENVRLVGFNRAVAGQTNPSDFANVVIGTAFSEETSYNADTRTLEIRLNQAGATWFRTNIDFALVTANDFDNVAPANADVGNVTWHSRFFVFTESDYYLTVSAPVSDVDGSNKVIRLRNEKGGADDPYRENSARRPLLGGGAMVFDSLSSIPFAHEAKSVSEFTFTTWCWIPSTWAAFSDIFWAGQWDFTPGGWYLSIDELGGDLRFRARFKNDSGEINLAQTAVAPATFLANYADRILKLSIKVKDGVGQLIIDNVVDVELADPLFNTIKLGTTTGYIGSITDSAPFLPADFRIYNIISASQYLSNDEEARTFLAYDIINVPTSDGVLVDVTVAGSTFGGELTSATLEKQTVDDQVTGTRTLVEQQGNNLIDLPYSFVVPEVLREYFTNTSKENYTKEEIEAEALANAAVSVNYADDPTNSQLDKVFVETDLQKVEIKTFGA